MGVPGVWLFHIGSAASFENVVPAAVQVSLTPPVLREQEALGPAPEYPGGEYGPDNDSFDDEQEYNIDPDFHDPDPAESRNPVPDRVTPDPEEHPENGRGYSQDTRLEAYPNLPDAEVISVDEDVDVQSGGQTQITFKPKCTLKGEGPG